MLHFKRGSSLVCIATYVGNNVLSNQTSSCSYDRQVPIRYNQRTASTPTEQKEKANKKFSYVIIGCGVSGSAALGEILFNSAAPTDGGRDILIVDSQRQAFAKLGNSDIITKSNMGRLQYMEGSVVDMDLPSRELKLSDGSIVKYDSCLISVGTKMSNINLGEKMMAEDCASDLVDMSVASSTEELMKAVRSGKHVSLIGADTWGVISIASQLADFSKLNGFKGTVSIITPSQGVMASSLPRYLSVALGKRLNTKGIELVPYSQVRYVGGPSTFAFKSGATDKAASPSDKDYYSSPQNAKIGLYLSRVYDSLNTSMLYTDKVALFPNSTPLANQGPPMNCSGHFAARAGLEVGLNGGFLVNRCMLASDGVYLSGEVANVRMSVGRGVFQGVDHAHHTGIVAGRNMAGVFDVYEHVPIYEASAEESDIHLTFVGHCCSAFETHGFWWKLGGSSSSSPPSSFLTAPSSPSSSSSSGSSSSGSGSGSGSRDISNSVKGPDKNGPQGLFDPISKPLSVAAETATGPVQQTMGQRLQEDFWQFFGFHPSVIKSSKAVAYVTNGKQNVRKISEDNGLRNKMQPPLGLGVLFYVDNDIVVGVLISGAPLAQQGEKDADVDELSFSEIIHERARSFVGKPLNAVAAMIEAENILEDGNGVSDFRSGRLIRLQNLSEIASYVIAPAIMPVDRSSRKGLEDGKDDTEVPRTEYKKTAAMLPRPNYRYSASSRTVINAYMSNLQTEVSSTIPPTVMQENVFHLGGDMTGTRAEKLAAAYASGLRYGLEGPGKG